MIQRREAVGMLTKILSGNLAILNRFDKSFGEIAMLRKKRPVIVKTEAPRKRARYDHSMGLNYSFHSLD